MGSRLFHVAIVLFWLVSMTWLIAAKVVPPLLVGEPPTYRSTMPAPDELIGWRIYWNGKPLGWAATRVEAEQGGVREIHNRVVLQHLPLSELVPPWLMTLTRYNVGKLDVDARTRTDINPFGQLDGFVSTIHISGLPSPIRMQGRVADNYLQTEVQFGDFNHKREDRLEAGTLINGEFSPLAVMPGLRIGQSWSIRSFSPLRPPHSPMEPMRAVVTREDWLNWDGRGVSAYVVEYRAETGTGLAASGPPRGTTWVLHDGRIVQQEVAILNSHMRFVRLNESEAQSLQDRLKNDSPIGFAPNTLRSGMEPSTDRD